MKRKLLKPTLRPKKRYLNFKIIGNNISYKKAKRSILESVHDLFGDFGSADSGIKFMADQYKDNSGILRVKPKFVDKIKVALAKITMIDRKKVLFHTVRVSGILKKANR